MFFFFILNDKHLRWEKCFRDFSTSSCFLFFRLESFVTTRRSGIFWSLNATLAPDTFMMENWKLFQSNVRAQQVVKENMMSTPPMPGACKLHCATSHPHKFERNAHTVFNMRGAERGVSCVCIQLEFWWEGFESVECGGVFISCVYLRHSFQTTH